MEVKRFKGIRTLRETKKTSKANWAIILEEIGRNSLRFTLVQLNGAGLKEITGTTQFLGKVKAIFYQGLRGWKFYSGWEKSQGKREDQGVGEPKFPQGGKEPIIYLPIPKEGFIGDPFNWWVGQKAKPLAKKAWLKEGEEFPPI